jgi:alkanesulfonate monooxygenase SsuD/methylene tetrahydromethanopterin reductase-like flavin-dependent oxidoreductase (luciferase family)
VTTVGAIFRPQYPPEQLLQVAQAADDGGLDELWLWEDCFAESAMSAAAAALGATSRIRLGLGVLPVPLRNVALTAMELATVERMFPGRLVAGLGHGVLDWMGQVGARVESPMTLLREYLTALREMLDGAEVSVAGRYVTLDRVRLTWPPSGHLALHVAAVRPQTLRLSGELGDGTVLTGGTTPAEVRAAREQIDHGRSAAGRSGPHRVTVYVMVTTGPHAAEHLRAEAQRWDFAPDADTGVAGDAGQVADGLRRWINAGADAVILQPAGGLEDLPGFVRFAGEVAPLLR